MTTTLKIMVTFITQSLTQAHTHIGCHGLGQGAEGGDIVKSVVGKCNVPKGSLLYADNYFMSLSLLSDLRKSGIDITGTLRQNRLENCPLTPKKCFAKKSRGEMESMTDGDSFVLQWKDIRPVICASNNLTDTPKTYVQRWCKSEGTHKSVQIPKLISEYN